MKKQIKYFTLLNTIAILFLSNSFANAQFYKIDSLNSVLKNCKEDSLKVNTLILVSSILSQTSLDSAIEASLQALKFSTKINWKKGVGKSYFMLGRFYYLKSDYPTSLSSYLKSLKIYEGLGLIAMQASVVSHIANIYVLQENYDKALEKYFSALNIAEKLKDKNSIASHLGNIGLTYTYKRDTKKALDYLLKALQLNTELNNETAIASNYDFIGYTYSVAGNYPKALEYLLQSLKINEASGNKIRILDNLRNIGEVYIKIGKFKEAEPVLKKALDFSENLGHLHGIEGTALILSELYDTIGKHEFALIYYKKFIAAHDSVTSDENQKKQVRTEMNFEFEKKEAVIKEQQDKERVITHEKSRFQQVIIGVVGIGLLFVIIFAAVIFRSLKITRHQKLIIEEKQREILDSIHYAKKIQTALMTNEKYIEKKLNLLQKNS